MDINEKLIKYIFNEDLEQVKECLAQGADVNFNNKRHYSPPIILASMNGNLEITKLLIEHRANVNATSKYGGEEQYYSTALIQSAHKGHKEHLEIAKLLIDNGADINGKDAYGWNPLMSAVNRGYMSDPDKQSLEFAKFFISKGADVNAKNEKDETALMIAISNNSNKAILETIQLLIDNGADVNTKNKYGKTALDYIISLKYIYAEQDFKKIKDFIVSKGGKLGSQVKTNTINKSKTKQKSNEFERGM